MSLNSDNRRRAFADVVTVDAWHDDFQGGNTKVDLYADVVFGTARLGGEIDSPVRFRLSVRRAELLVVIPELEPVSVDTKSVSRDSPEFQGHLTQTIEESAQASTKGVASGSLSSSEANASISAEGSLQASRSASNKLELSGVVKLIIVTQSKSPEGHYRWLLESRTKGPLEGRPWNAQVQPRLKLIDERKDRSKGIPPTVRVEVCCRREDLVISDLQIKDEGIWDSVKARAGFKNRVAAAESYIREKLSEEGLEAYNMQDIFGQVTLANTIAQTL